MILALVGQAVALQLIEAGPSVRYQHYIPFTRLWTERPVLLCLYLVVQTAMVMKALTPRWPQIRLWLSHTFKRWQLFGVALLSLLFSATVSRDVSTYIAELLFASAIQLINLATIIMLAWSLPTEVLNALQRKGRNLFGTPHAPDATAGIRVDRYAVLAAIWVLVVAVILNVFSYERHPHIADEVVYLLHARYFAEGVLAMPSPPVPEAFEVYLMRLFEGRWYPAPPPGWPAMLSLGVLLGLPWLVNPVLAGLNILLAYVLLGELYDRRTARLSILFMCVSPWYVFMAMNFMTHMFTFTCALAAAVARVQARKRQKMGWGWASGAAIGVVSLVRPLNGFMVAALIGLWGLGLGGQRLKFSVLITLILGTICVGALVLPYNSFLTGDPNTFPIMAYTDEHFGPNANALGFGPDRGMGWAIDPYPGHSPIDALVNANLNAFMINMELFGWSSGSLILIAFMIFSGKLCGSDYLMLTVIAVVFGVYFFYYFSGGPDFGARYWFLMLLPCVALNARGLQSLASKLNHGAVSLKGNGVCAWAAVLALSICTLVNYFPWRAIDKYHHYRGMRPDIRTLANTYDFGTSLVLIRGASDPDYMSAAVYNPVDLRAAAPVYAWERNLAVRSQLLKAYPYRPVWIVNGPTVTKRGFQVIAGPLSARQLEQATVFETLPFEVH